MIAVRHLRYGLSQTLLTVGVVAISVTLIIFLNSLIRGLQKSLIKTTTGSIPHIEIKQPEREPIAAWELECVRKPCELYKGEAVPLELRKRKIEDWRVWVGRLSVFDPGITAVSAYVLGDGFIGRGEKREAVVVTGVDPREHNKIVDIESNLVAGRFFQLTSSEVVIGSELAKDIGVKVGDKVRITSSEGTSGIHTVAGIFNTGFQAVDTRTAYVTLRDAQSLFGLGRAVTNIGVKLDNVFKADRIAGEMRLQVPYEVQPWTEENRQLLTALRSQTQSSTMILFFTVIAAGFGIGSILITAVTSKLREIGILKAMGATQKQIVGIFTLESTLMSVMGGLLGAGMGVGFSLLAYKARLATAGDRPQDVFAPDLSLYIVGGAFLVAVLVGYLASLYPAKRAGSVDPIQVIRST